MWEQIRSNQIRSAVLTFGLGILLLAVGYFLGLYFFGSPTGGLVIALILWAVMSLVAYFQGDSIFLAMSGARKINRDDFPRLYNLVEEMRIASGLEKMPDIYVIDDPALNAFATGRDPNRAALAVTSGLLQKLNRDELQGVIGHEVAHIKNRDVLLMTMAGILLGTIVMLAWYATRVLFFSGVGSGGGRRSSKSGGGQAQIIVLAVGIVLMILAPIFAQLLYFAISRRREYLADASSALYTRYPDGLASALEKLATSDTQVRTANKATAPMYTINPFQKRGMSVENLTSTHPPIAERVRILRAMGGASYTDYERAYEQAKKQKLMPASALAAAGAMPVRAAQSEGVEKTERAARTHETSQALWKLSGYRTIDCPCGAKLRVPPDRLGPVKCPHCGRVHQL